MASTPRGSYSSLDLSTEVPLSTEDEDLAAVEGFASFIPLLRFQTDKLFGVVALPVFYLVACALLLMNFLTLALPILGFDLVETDPSNTHFVLIEFRKAKVTPAAEAEVVPLKPCIYKRR